jgi:methionyl-tRNA formyltransferase
MTPWPGAWFTHEGTAVKINTARLTSPNLQGTTHEPFYHAAPGTVTVQKGRLWFHAADGPVELTQVTPAGKRPMPGGSFPL